MIDPRFSGSVNSVQHPAGGALRLWRAAMKGSDRYQVKPHRPKHQVIRSAFSPAWKTRPEDHRPEPSLRGDSEFFPLRPGGRLKGGGLGAMVSEGTGLDKGIGVGVGEGCRVE